MKHINILILTFILLFTALFSGCSSNNKTEASSDSFKTLHSKTSASLKNDASYATAVKYIKKWAKKNSISVDQSTDKFTVLKLKKTDGFSDAKTVTLQMPLLTSNNYDQQIQVLSVMLKAVKNSEHHGKVYIVFTADDSSHQAAKNLPKKYVNTDNFLALNHNDTINIINNGAGLSYIDLKRKIKYNKPHYQYSYKIRISGLTSLTSDTLDEDHANPIQIIGDLLATYQSKGIIFELVSFNGGNNRNTFPSSATAVINTTEADKDSIIKWFETSSEDFNDDYGDIEINARYTITETKLRKKAISLKETDNIVSLLYTLHNGIYQKDDEGNISAASNIGIISTRNDYFSGAISVRTLNRDLLDQMHELFATTCGLSDMLYEMKNIFYPWITYEEGEMVSLLEELSDKKAASTMTESENCIFKDRKADLNIATLQVNAQDGEKCSQIITDFLENQKNDDNQ